MMNSPIKILQIGCGSMGSVIARNLLTLGAKVFTILPTESTSAARVEELGASVIFATEDLQLDLSQYDIIILTIKPNNLEALKYYQKLLAPSPHQQQQRHIPLLSVLAGTRIATLREFFPQLPIIRLMPNVNLATPNPDYSDKDHGTSSTKPPKFLGLTPYYMTKKDADLINSNTPIKTSQFSKALEAFGSAIAVSSEDEIDKYTAITGSGPAFVAEILQSYLLAALDLGLSAEETSFATLKTFSDTIASLSLNMDPSLPSSPLSISQLEQFKKSITSKGGTTQAGLLALAEHEIDSTIAAAIKAAYLRAQELSEPASGSKGAAKAEQAKR